MATSFQIQTEDGQKTVSIDGVTDLSLTFNGIVYRVIGPNVEAAFRSFFAADMACRQEEADFKYEQSQRATMQKIRENYAGGGR